MQTKIDPRTVEIRETDLFETWCVALESGEFTQIRKRMDSGDPNEEKHHCAMGVARVIAKRAGVYDPLKALGVPIHPRFYKIATRAGVMLGSPNGLEEANDAGESFAIIAAALRAARLEVEATPEPDRAGEYRKRIAQFEQARWTMAQRVEYRELTAQGV